jgi:hypothetical protein
VQITADLEAKQRPDLLPDWSEAHRLDLFDDADLMAVSFQVGIHPHRGHASFLASVLELGALPIVIAEHEVPLPGVGWEIRASGLWADHICETALDHWSYGLEAFALAVDEPEELLGRAFGDRVPLGWELEFEASEPATAVGASGYSQAGRAHGLLLSADGARSIDGVAVRSHWWAAGRPRAITVGQPADPVVTKVALPGVGCSWSHLLSKAGLKIIRGPLTP